MGKNAAADARFKSFAGLPEDTFEAFLSVPLVAGGEVTGVINVHHKAPHQHTSDEATLVTFIGEQMGGALDKARLAEHSQNAVRRMETLAAVAQKISTEGYLDPDFAGHFGDGGRDFGRNNLLRDAR